MGLGGGGGGEHKRAARWRRDERCAHSTTPPGGTGDVTESIRPCGFVCRTSSPRVLPSFVKLFVETLAAAAGEPRVFCTHRCVLMDQDHSGKTAARVTRAVLCDPRFRSASGCHQTTACTGHCVATDLVAAAAAVAAGGGPINIEETYRRRARPAASQRSGLSALRTTSSPALTSATARRLARGAPLHH